MARQRVTLHFDQDRHPELVQLIAQYKTIDQEEGRGGGAFNRYVIDLIERDIRQATSPQHDEHSLIVAQLDALNAEVAALRAALSEQVSAIAPPPTRTGLPGIE